MTEKMIEEIIKKLENRLKVPSKASQNVIARPKIIAIVGPTASGKSSLAIRIAKKIDGHPGTNSEIISADSRLVYKGFDIATAKPTVEERQGVEHHLIDVVEPEVDYSAANFLDDAKAAIEKIVAKGKIPIVVGGTGLYFRILLEDFDLPRVEPNYELRKELEALDAVELHEMLKELDPVSAQKIHFNNKVKLIRALEVCKTLDKPHSEAAGKKEPEYDVIWLGLNPPDRAVLYDRVNQRVDEMVKNGLIEETQMLLKKHGRIPNFVNTIGYQEILAYFDGEITLEEAVSDIKQNTRRYAKRQLTWFRRNKLIEWLDV